VVNEIAMLCDRMDINVWEVSDAAAPSRSAHAFLPGPGLGGHCFPIDRFICLGDEAGRIEARFIGWRLYQRPDAHFVVTKIQSAMNRACKAAARLAHSYYGRAYNRDHRRCARSPALDIIHLLDSGTRR